METGQILRLLASNLYVKSLIYNYVIVIQLFIDIVIGNYLLDGVNDMNFRDKN